MKKRLYILGSCASGAIAGVIGSAVNAFAALEMPVLPVTDLESAGTAVLGLVAVAVVIGIVIRTFKKA